MKVLVGIFSQPFLTLRLRESKLAANNYKDLGIGNKRISYGVSEHQSQKVFLRECGRITLSRACPGMRVRGAVDSR
jgi:hypothetical protein